MWSPSRVDVLVSWTKKNTHHRLLPFGAESRATSWSEFEREGELRRARRERNRLRVVKVAAEILARKAEASKDCERRRYESAERGRKLARKLDCLRQLSIEERIRWLAVQETLPLGALPPALFYCENRVLGGLGKELLFKLYQKLTRRGGKESRWHQLRQLVADSCDEHWGESWSG
jgi:hypothetical protein